MKLADFDFDLPEDRIATRPCEPRDAAKLLRVSGGEVGDHVVRELPQLLRAGDMLVFNDTKVIPARLFGTRGDARVEVTLHKEVIENLEAQTERLREPSARGALPHGEGQKAAAGVVYKAFAKPARKLQIGERFDVADDFYAEVTGKGEGGEVTLAFNVSGAAFHQALATHGETPLPPYIAARRAADDTDKDSYQTLFAKHEGAVAAPTASLHYTPELMRALEAAGIKHSFVTLHVGAGTFLPVKVDDISEHKMHSEWCEMSIETAEAINATKAAGGRIIPVGTTSLRTLESLADEDGWVHPDCRETDIFITPGYTFKCTDALLTNFHTPKSTLFMLVCALMGGEVMCSAYAHAIDSNYRFYSYGDACLLEP